MPTLYYYLFDLEKEKLVLKHGEDEVFSRGGANKRQQKPSKPVENKENFDPVTPAHNKVTFNFF